MMFIIIIIGINTNAQNKIRPRGWILDRETQKPIFAANIALAGTDIGLISDKEGYWTFPNPIQVGSDLIISAIGYEDTLIRIKDTNNYKIALIPSPILLNEILVVEHSSDQFGQSNILTGATDQYKLQKNVSDLLLDAPGFSFVKRGAFAVDPVYRGNKYNQLNVQFDGGAKVMHACPNRMDPITTHLIPEEVERIELIRGPFSVRFGPNFGGVLNLITHVPSEKGIHGSLKSGYESNGKAFIAQGQLSVKKDRFDVKTELSYRDFNNYVDGNGKEVPSAFQTLDYSLLLGVKPTTNQRFQLKWMQSFGKNMLHAGLPMDSRKNNSRLGTFNYKLRNISSLLYSIDAKAYLGMADHLMTNEGRKNFFIMEASTPVQSFTSGGKVEFLLHPFSQTFLYVGTDVSHLHRTGDRIRIVKRNPRNPTQVFDTPKIFRDSIWQNSTIYNTGFFIEGKQFLSSKAIVKSGLRLDYNRATILDPSSEIKKLYGNLDHIRDLNLSGNISLNYLFSEKIRWGLALGRGVRSASMEERFINHLGIDLDPYEYVGNPYLKPEANHQIEGSIKYLGQVVSYGTNFYYSYITNYISARIDSSLKRKYRPWVHPTVAKRFVNLDKVLKTGFEAFLNYNPSEYIRFKIDGSYVYAQDINLKEPLPLIAPFTGHFSVQWENALLRTELLTTFTGAQNRISERFGEKYSPSYWLFDANVYTKPFHGWTLGLSVTNIFDRAYYQHLSFVYRNSDINKGRIYEPGRSFHLLAKYKF